METTPIEESSRGVASRVIISNVIFILAGSLLITNWTCCGVRIEPAWSVRETVYRNESNRHALALLKMGTRRPWLRRCLPYYHRHHGNKTACHMQRRATILDCICPGKIRSDIQLLDILATTTRLLWRWQKLETRILAMSSSTCTYSYLAIE